MQRIIRKGLLLCFVLLGFNLWVLTSSASVSAQVPPPTVDCDETASPEYHSLRPYQKSPCNTTVSTTANFCGNNLVIKKTITVGPGDADECTDNGNGQTCRFTITSSEAIAVDLSGAELPIMGLTDGVINSQNTDSDIPYPEKVNNYLSWYLNGTINRAEYPFLDISKAEDIARIIDHSGPLRKLLPWEVQLRTRRETVNNALATLSGECPDLKCKENRHDQVVACTYGIPVRLFGFIDLGQIGRIPAPCYLPGLLGDLLYPLRDSVRLSDWENHLPPLQTDEEYQDKSFSEYWVDYRRWRGDVCGTIEIPESFLGISLPFGGAKYVVCADLVTAPNYYADLFPYIPFTSTEDRKGEVRTSTLAVQPSSEGVIVSNVSFSNQTPAELFFPHMEEVNQLGNLLQSTYVPKNEGKTGPVTEVTPNQFCDLANIRTNPGDDLFAEGITGDLSYTAEFSCDFAGSEPGEPPPATVCNTVLDHTCVPKDWKCAENSGQLDCPDGYKCSDVCKAPPQNEDQCSKDILVNLALVTKTPLVDNIWSRLVAGPTAIFKRIFPKVGGPKDAFGCLLDMPAATKVTFSGEGLILAGNPKNQRSGEGAELYFPHIGSLSEYFLKGIQTALRPKGYGEQIAFGAPGNPFCSQASGSACSTQGGCNPNPADVSLDGVEAKFIDLATRWLGVGNPRTDRYAQVVSLAQDIGLDPIFALAIWLHESGASNYAGVCQVLGGGDPSSGYCQGILDFGVNNPDIVTIIDANGNVIEDHFNDQLGAFLNLPGYYLEACDPSQAACPMEIFGAMFQSGECPPAGRDGYTAGIKEIYSWLAPGQQFPCYPIAVP